MTMAHLLPIVQGISSIGHLTDPQRDRDIWQRSPFPQQKAILRSCGVLLLYSESMGMSSHRDSVLLSQLG
jgi:hypothetical protein